MVVRKFKTTKDGMKLTKLQWIVMGDYYIVERWKLTLGPENIGGKFDQWKLVWAYVYLTEAKALKAYGNINNIKGARG